MSLEQIAKDLEQLAVSIENFSAQILERAEKLLDDVKKLEDKSATGDTVLPVPYLSQWDVPDADDRPGDCGPACVAMLVRYLTYHEPTVDEVANYAGQSKTGSGKWYTNFTQLKIAAQHYGIKLEIQRPLTLERIRTEIDVGNPVIALINYGVLGQYHDNQDDYRGAHWVLVVGYDDEAFYINDPDFLRDRRNEGDHRRITSEALDDALGTVSHTPGNSYDHQGLVLA